MIALECKSANLSDPTHSLDMVNCAMMHGLAISLPESNILQSACGWVLAPTRMSTLEYGQALRHGSRPPEAWAVTAGGHSIGTAAGHIVEHLRRGVGSYSDFQVGEARMT